MQFPIILIVILIATGFANSKNPIKWVRRCKRSMEFRWGTSNGQSIVTNHGCSKNVWIAMDRASKCPQLNGEHVDGTVLRESQVQPRLYGRRGIYSAHCEYMVIVVKSKGCILLNTEEIEFKCRNNSIFYNGREVSSFVCAESTFE